MPSNKTKGGKGKREMNSSHAVNSEEEDASSETGSLLSERGAGVRGRRKKKGGPCHYRWISSRGALMVLAWNLLVFSYQSQTLNGILKLFPSYYMWEPWKKMSAYLAFGLALPRLFLYPIAGWMADTKFGRYRVLKGSLWTLWISSILLLITHLLKYGNMISEYIVVLPVLVVYCVNAIGLAGFQANIIPFGIDQMEDGSADQYSSFVHWYYWTRNFSFGLILTFILHSVILQCPDDPNLDLIHRIELIVLVAEVGLLSLALLLDFFFSHVLVKEPRALNPLKTVYNVSAFIIHHKHPVGQRSALTYERGYYARADLATIPYGGPFEVEDVEAVKTFWRMIIFLFLVSTANVPISAVNSGMSYLIGPRVSTHYCQMSYFIITVSNPLVFIIALPVYEFVVYPIIHKYILPMMRRIGVGYLLGLLAVIGALVVSVLGRPPTFQCVFYRSDEEFSIREWMIFIPILVSSFAEMLVFIPAYEFICAQSPYNMQGLLIGCFYALQGVGYGLAALILLVFAEGYSRHRVQESVFECEFWFNFVVLLLTIVGLVVFTVVVRWYRKRERDYLDRDYINEREIIEAYYDRSM